MKTIKIATDYSNTPLGRYLEDSEFNGTRFREEFLKPALEKEGEVEVDIDGVEGYGSSFLDEAFGGLVRKGYFKAAELHRKLVIRNADPDLALYRDLIWKYIRQAEARKAP
ncbi:MAG TPA: STAS-like domain-containing protein [Verrucomicrobiae bacterium]